MRGDCWYELLKNRFQGKDVIRQLVAALVLGVLVSGCVHVGATITNAPTIPDCIPGSATKPCR
jgi:hypothetical protein